MKLINRRWCGILGCYWTQWGQRFVTCETRHEGDELVERQYLTRERRVCGRCGKTEQRTIGWASMAEIAAWTRAQMSMHMRDDSSGDECPL